MGKSGKETALRRRRKRPAGQAVCLARTAAAHANKARIGVSAFGLAKGDDLVGLRIGHAGFDLADDPAFREAGVFQAADFAAREGGLAGEFALHEELDGGIRKTDEAKRDKIAAHHVELICFGDIENLLVAETRALETANGIGAGEDVLVLMGGADQSDAGIVGEACLLEADELSDFRIGRVQRLQLLDAVGPHAGLVERAIVGERMLAAGRKDTSGGNCKKNESVSHAFSLAATRAGQDRCAVGDTGLWDRWAEGSVGLVDALDAEDAGDFADIEEDGFELAAVRDFEIGVNARVAAVGAAFEFVNIGAGSADDGSDLREEAGAVEREDGETHRERGGGGAAPLDGDAALGLIEEILHVGAEAGVDGDAPAARDVADNFVTGNGIAALGAIDEQVVMALDHQGSFAKAKHAFDRGDNGRLRGCGIGRAGGFGGFAEDSGEDLARGIFSEADGGVEVLRFREAMLGGQLEHFVLGNFLQAFAEMARFVFEEALAHFGGFFALLDVDPVTDFAFCVRGLREGEPVAAGPVALLGEDFDHVAADDFVAERNHLAIYLGADALVADFGVHGIREVDRCGAARQLEDAALGRESVNLERREVDLERAQEFSGFLQFLGPFDELSHPRDTAVVVIRPRLARFVLPVSSDALLRDTVHLLRANLHFERLAAVENRGVQRLIQIRARHRYVVLETPRNRMPDVVNDT